MDQKRFDELVQRLSEHVSRRSVVTSAVAGSAAAASGAIDARAGKRGKGKNDGRASKPGTAGPCGSGKRKDNICTKNKDCCTGICAVEAGKKNKDGKGRCRCVRTGDACQVDKNCCNAPCIGGVCGFVS